MQIRHKLALQFSFIVAFLLLIALLLIYYTFSKQIKAEFYKGLESKALMTAEMLVKYQTLSPIDISQNSDNSSEIELPAKEKVIIYNDKFEKVYAFHSSDKVPEIVLRNIANSESFKFKMKDYESLGIRYRNKLNENYLLVCQGMFFSDDLVKLRNILIWVFFLVISFVGLGGYLFSKQALSPVSMMMNQIDAVFPSQIGKRLEVSENNDELSRLAVMFNKLLDRAEEAFLNQKGFLSNISHEIKNPLTAVITQLDVLLQKERTPNEYQTAIKSTMMDIHELKDIAEQLMQLARLTSGDDAATLQPLRLDEIVWQAKSNLLRLHPEYNFRIDTSFLPDDPDNLIIKGNEQLLKTAISNLCSNACKFSEDQFALISIKTGDNGTLTLEISDNGKPIPKSEQEMIFKAFYRSPSTRHIKGTGIGLPLVQHILKMHHATLKLTSGETRGNTFTIEFKKAINQH